MLGTTTALGRVTTAGSGDQSIWFTHTDNVAGRSVTIRLGNNDGTYKTYSPYVQGIVGNGIDNYSLAFGTSSATSGGAVERARITSGGDFLVGGTTQVGGGSGATISTASRSSSCMLALQAANGSGYNSIIYFECPGSNAGTISYMRNNDRFEVIAGGSGGVSLAAGGTSWVSLSDERNKDIIEPIANAINKVATLRAVIGKYKTDANDKRRPFLIAQDVQAVLPEAVEEAKDDGTLGLSYSDVIPLLVAAIKELSAKVTALESK
jgi:hypothetical protein